MAVLEIEAPRRVVRIQGEQDASTVACLSRTLAEAIAVDDADLVVDLSEVGFLDCAAAGVILRAGQFLSARSRSLVVRAPPRSGRRVLEVCGAAALIERRPVGAGPARRGP